MSPFAEEYRDLVKATYEYLPVFLVMGWVFTLVVVIFCTGLQHQAEQETLQKCYELHNPQDCHTHTRN